MNTWIDKRKKTVINKVCYSGDYYSAIKRNKVLIYTLILMNLEDTQISERRSREPHTT